MTIAFTPELEAAIMQEAQRDGKTPEDLVLEAVQEKFVTRSHSPVLELREPRDEWERLLRSAASPAGVSLTDEQLSREVMYEDHD